MHKHDLKTIKITFLISKDQKRCIIKQHANIHVTDFKAKNNFNLHFFVSKGQKRCILKQ